jgi:hypothetical protein
MSHFKISIQNMNILWLFIYCCLFKTKEVNILEDNKCDLKEGQIHSGDPLM